MNGFAVEAGMGGLGYISIAEEGNNRRISIRYAPFESQYYIRC